jgi:hypothetical protein
MHTSILSELERKRIRAFTKADGEKSSAMRGLATRSRQSLAKIEEDLALIREFLRHYEAKKA